MDDLLQRVRAWRDDDPDPGTRAEVDRLLEANDEAGLRDRFDHRLKFGTAGLRGPLGAGPNRMNRALVRRAAAGLARYLSTADPEATARGVVVGYDARHQSDLFAADTVAVLAGAGLRALLLPGPLPTPVLAFSIRHLGAAAGVMVTASHNPAADNGYKVYLGDGAQIVPPVDNEISAAIGDVASLADVTLADDGDPLIERLGDDVVDAYVGAVAAMVGPPAGDPVLVYTPLHGVGGTVLGRVFERAGYQVPVAVGEQAVPDPDFPTVAFPNPEEPGALDLALAEAARHGATAVIANDPDADRLAVAVPDAGGWRALSGDELGALLADHVLDGGRGDDRLVVTTIVSSTLLRRMASDRGVDYDETLTGFKWIARAAADRPDRRFVFGYEEALGYAVGDLVRDKDGLSAALVFAELAARLAAEGRTIADQLEELARRYGLHATRQWSVRLEGVDGLARIDETMTRLRASPLLDLAGRKVTRVDDLLAPGGRLPPSDVVRLELAGDVRVIARPSGTEPKLKLYFELVLPVPPDREGYARARAEAAAELESLQSDSLARLGF